MAVRDYEIWLEGYAVSGQHGTAVKIGTVAAESFQEACDSLLKRPGQRERFGGYDSERLTVWGCELFDNETDARKSYG